MKTKKVLVTLTPTGRFYFGGETRFEVENKTNSSSSYIVKSNAMPQQTSLLGMMRFLILSNNEEAFNRNKNQIENPDKAAILIGQKSFNVQLEELHFGQISKIGTCFIQCKKVSGDEWEVFYPIPMDYAKRVVGFKSNTNGHVNSKRVIFPQIGEQKDCQDNHGKTFAFISQNDTLEFDEVFTEDSRVGIKKDYSGETKDKSFFKQISYRLGKKESDNEFRFAFFAELDQDIKLDKLNKQMVSVGGDSSNFVIEFDDNPTVTKIEDLYTAINECKAYKVILTSDSFVHEKGDLDYDFAITDTIPFRFLHSSVENTTYNILKKELRIEKQYELLKRGSVFYFVDKGKANTFEAMITGNTNFEKIGYNQCVIIEPKIEK